MVFGSQGLPTECPKACLEEGHQGHRLELVVVVAGSFSWQKPNSIQGESETG